MEKETKEWCGQCTREVPIGSGDCVSCKSGKPKPPTQQRNPNVPPQFYESAKKKQKDKKSTKK